jgi:L,D-peptidoglycan transpeptidase YkuD (ErfK/YbiS/YcfS/YnhG family)
MTGLVRTSFLLCIMTLLVSGCSPFSNRSQVKTIFEEANVFSSQGDYQTSLDRYEQIIEKHPSAGDRALFEMGTIHAHPRNGQKDYNKSLECFQKLIRDYPTSGYRHDAEMMIFYISSVVIKDKAIATQQTKIENLQLEIKKKGDEVSILQNQIDALEQKVFSLTTRIGSIDRILVEKKRRQLKLIAKGEVIKAYKIALGGNPEGPKEKQGDNKTPEGTYFIDSKNKDSRYHLALHISYPNERDKQRAKELGVSPGGDIMIHGIKNGFSWIGDSHAEIDWTKGCIAVTDTEIEEIYNVARVGTVVEIRP